MSTGIKKNKIEQISEKDILTSLKKKKVQAFNNIIDSSKISSLRKTVYLSNGGKYYKYADFLLKFVYDIGYVPIHPILTLNYFVSTTSHDNKKEEVIKDCFSLMNNSDELWVFDENLPTYNADDKNPNKKHISKFPEGVLVEILWWLRYKKNSPIRFFTWGDIGIPKYLHADEWHLAPNGEKLEERKNEKPGRFAIIDLGSSTIKLTVSEIDEYNQISVLLKKSITTNLAEDYFETNTIKDDAKERTIQGLKDLKDEAVEYGVVDFKLIATKVVRDAKNSVDVIKEIRQETNLDLEILSKEDETKYVVKAVLESFDNKDLDMLIINAGGGSSQVSFNIDNKINEYSLPIGISDLNEKFIQEYPIKDSKYKEMKEFIKETLNKEIKDIPKINTMVYTGGELDYMLMTGFPLKEFDGSISHPKKTSLKSFKEYATKMREMELEEIQAFMPNNPNWMNGAIASNTLLETLAELFKVITIIPSNKNVNDGILLTMK